MHVSICAGFKTAREFEKWKGKRLPELQYKVYKGGNTKMRAGGTPCDTGKLLGIYKVQNGVQYVWWALQPDQQSGERRLRAPNDRICSDLQQGGNHWRKAVLVFPGDGRPALSMDKFQDCFDKEDGAQAVCFGTMRASASQR